MVGGDKGVEIGATGISKVEEESCREIRAIEPRPIVTVLLPVLFPVQLQPTTTV